MEVGDHDHYDPACAWESAKCGNYEHDYEHAHGDYNDACGKTQAPARDGDGAVESDDDGGDSGDRSEDEDDDEDAVDDDAEGDSSGKCHGFENDQAKNDVAADDVAGHHWGEHCDVGLHCVYGPSDTTSEAKSNTPSDSRSDITSETPSETSSDIKTTADTTATDSTENPHTASATGSESTSEVLSPSETTTNPSTTSFITSTRSKSTAVTTKPRNDDEDDDDDNEDGLIVPPIWPIQSRIPPITLPSIPLPKFPQKSNGNDDKPKTDNESTTSKKEDESTTESESETSTTTVRATVVKEKIMILVTQAVGPNSPKLLEELYADEAQDVVQDGDADETDESEPTTLETVTRTGKMKTTGTKEKTTAKDTISSKKISAKKTTTSKATTGTKATSTKKDTSDDETTSSKATSIKKTTTAKATSSKASSTKKKTVNPIQAAPTFPAIDESTTCISVPEGSKPHLTADSWAMTIKSFCRQNPQGISLPRVGASCKNTNAEGTSGVRWTFENSECKETKCTTDGKACVEQITEIGAACNLGGNENDGVVLRGNGWHVILQAVAGCMGDTEDEDSIVPDDGGATDATD
ncbi:hypothetical protein EDC01DRAFT_781059 [Geopyxis carbonaria]|nr:hypothetical protein EDC01DRAFT_781059 [Geopyxis carbonaria]